MHPFLYHNKNVPTAPAVTCLKYIVFLPSPYGVLCRGRKRQTDKVHSHTRTLVTSSRRPRPSVLEPHISYH